VNDLVEHVAKSMLEHDQLNDEAKFSEWEEAWEARGDLYRELACAALVGVSSALNQLVLGFAAERLRTPPTTDPE